SLHGRPQWNGTGGWLASPSCGGIQAIPKDTRSDGRRGRVVALIVEKERADHRLALRAGGKGRARRCSGGRAGGGRKPDQVIAAASNDWPESWLPGQLVSRTRR